VERIYAPPEMHQHRILCIMLLQKMHQLLEEISFLLFARGGGGKAVARCILIGSLPQSLLRVIWNSLGYAPGIFFLSSSQPLSLFSARCGERERVDERYK
jgi:hypothetical protein